MFACVRLLPAAALLLTPALAQAADYDPPIFVEEAAPEYVPVEVGSGWYLRGDVAYSTNKTHESSGLELSPIRYNEDENPVSGSIGFGYHFTDYLRADLNLAYIPGAEISAWYDDGDVAANGSLSNRAWTGMANAYVDLGTYVGITPYVGAGVGVFQSTRKLEAHYNDPSNDIDLDFNDRDKQYSIAYSLGAGFAYSLTKNVSVDLGYQYLAAPDAEYAEVRDMESYPVRNSLDYHQVKVGLRYDLW